MITPSISAAWMILALMAGETGAAGGMLLPGYAIEQCSQDCEHRQGREIAGCKATNGTLQTNHVREVLRGGDLCCFRLEHECRCYSGYRYSGDGASSDQTAGVKHAWSRLYLSDRARTALCPALNQPPHSTPDDRAQRSYTSKAPSRSLKS